MSKLFAILTLVAIQLFVLRASALTLSMGFPVRTGTARTAPPVGVFDLASPNAGINRADCFDVVQKWQFAIDAISADATSLQIWASAEEKSCAAPAERKGGEGAAAPRCYRVATFSPEEVRGKTFETTNLAIIHAADKKQNVEAAALDAGLVCARAEHMKPTTIYLHFMAFSGDAVVGYSSDAATSVPEEHVYRTLYDLMGPNPPGGVSLGVGEGMLTVKFSAQTATDFALHRAYCFRGATVLAGSIDAGADAADAADAAPVSKCPAGHPFVAGSLPTAGLDAYVCGESKAPAADIILDKVENEIPYAVAVVGLDKQGNFGMLSDVVCDTPRATNSLYDNYTGAGGTAGGGYCSVGELGASSSDAVFYAALLLLGVLVARRRVALPLAAALVMFAAPGRAQELSAGADAREKMPMVAVEARFGPYRPSVDRAFKKSPFKSTFGDATRMMGGAQIDWQPIHLPHLGSIGFGGLFGYTYASAKADFADGKGTSDETTTFNLWVLSLLTTVRFDALARETVVPIVPYAKAGLMWGLWNSSDGRGISRGPNGRDARGRTNGFFYAVGAMLLLNKLDPEAAKVFAAERGVKNSYVFAELTIADLRGYGQTDAMQVGDISWTAGLAFEM